MESSEMSIAQVGAAVVGVVYVLVGVIGFLITGFDGFVTDGSKALLGFEINPFHNIIHLVVGGYLILVARLGKTATEGGLIGGGLVYLLAAFLGFDNHLQLISINGAFALDNFLHLVSGSVAVGLGVFSVLLTEPEGPGDVIEHA